LLWISSSTATGSEYTVSGVVILVTMSSNKLDGTEVDSSFVLKFFCSRNDKVFPPERVLYPSSLVTGEGPQIATFPKNNAVDYKNNANHFMLISRPSGRDFHLTTTLIDTEPDKDFYRLFVIDDDSAQTRFISKYA